MLDGWTFSKNRVCAASCNGKGDEVRDEDSKPYNGCEAPDLLGFSLSADVADCGQHGEMDHPY